MCSHDQMQSFTNVREKLETINVKLWYFSVPLGKVEEKLSKEF